MSLGSRIYHYFGSLLQKANFPQPECHELQNRLMVILLCRFYPKMAKSLSDTEREQLKTICEELKANQDKALTDFETLAQKLEHDSTKGEEVTSSLMSEAETIVNHLTGVFVQHTPNQVAALKSEFSTLKHQTPA